uniref:Glutaredoxin domain-containing protein n=1 Tax=Parastrongyloides trichosuri TaxID=131310 RepID=A0A0N5A350_PARTI
MVNFLNKLMGKKSKNDWGPGHSLNDDRSNEADVPNTLRNIQHQGTATVPKSQGTPSAAAIKAREAALARIEAQRQRKAPQKGGIIDRQIVAQQRDQQPIAHASRPEDASTAVGGEDADEPMENDNAAGGLNPNNRGNITSDSGSGDGSNGSGGENEEAASNLIENISVLEEKVHSVNYLMQRQLYKFIVGTLDLGSYNKEYDLDFNYDGRSPEECHEEDLRRIAAIDFHLSELTKAGTLDVTNNPHFEDMDYLLLKILFPNYTTLYICMRKEDKLNYLIRHLRDVLTYDLPFVLEIPVSPLRKEVKSEDNNCEAFKYHGLFPCGMMHLKYDNEIQDQIETANEGRQFDYVKPTF